MHQPLRIIANRFKDTRGWFSESYSQRRLLELGIDANFVQDNHSYSAARGTLRGLHFQSPPNEQAKLVRCVSGKIWDVAVDLRKYSMTYGKWVAAELTAAGGEQLYIPAGFGHGFLTLTEDTEVVYKSSNYYSPECEGGVAWNDSDIAIEWPLCGRDPVMSEKDRSLPRLCDLASPFPYGGLPLVPFD
jgi:dTDP-4-dehydrorhamnose 3,5-epimerase